MHLAWFSDGPGRSRTRTHFVVRVCGLERPGPSESRAMMHSCFHCFFFFIFNKSCIKLINYVWFFTMWLVHSGREERQASYWSRSSEFFIFLQHLYIHFIFLGSAMLSFWLLGVMGKWFGINDNLITVRVFLCKAHMSNSTSCFAHLLHISFSFIPRFHLPLFCYCFWDQKVLRTSMAYGFSSCQPYLPQ